MKELKRKTFVAAVIILGIIFFAWLNFSPKEPIKAGLVATLTGAKSGVGVFQRNGTILAFEEVNRAGGINGRMLELIARDDGGNTEIAAKSADELADMGVTAILGHTFSTQTLAMVPVADKRKKLLIGLSASSTKLSGKDDFFIRISATDDLRSPALATAAFKLAGVRKAVGIFDQANAVYGEGYLALFKSRFETLGGEMAAVISIDSRHEVSHIGTAEEILRYKPDSVVFTLPSIHSAMICQHLAKYDGTIRFFGTGTFTEHDFVRLGGKAVEGATFVDTIHMDSANQQFREIRRCYAERFGTDADSSAIETGRICSFTAQTPS